MTEHQRRMLESRPWEDSTVPAGNAPYADYLYRLYPKPQVTLVQLGAFPGVFPMNHDDIIEKFIRMRSRRDGLKAVLVEPEMRNFKRTCRHYSGCPGVICVQCAVSDYDGEGFINSYGAGRGLSHLADEGDKVPVVHPYTLFHNYEIEDDFDLLQTDTEGSDFKVLNEMNFGRWKPKAINYERVFMTVEEEFAIRNKLEQAGYEVQVHSQGRDVFAERS